MRNLLPYILLVVWVIAGACRKVFQKVNYCGFNYNELVPDSSCISGMRVTAEYLNNELNALDFYSQNKLVKRDTVLTVDNNEAYISQFNLLRNDILKVSTQLNDTTRTFIFFRKNNSYELGMLESNYSDSTIKVEVFINSRFTTNLIRRGTVDSLRNYMDFAPPPLPYDYVIIKYLYTDSTLQYQRLEAHSNLRGLGGPDYYEVIPNPYHCIYLDMELIEERSTLMLYKQLNDLLY